MRKTIVPVFIVLVLAASSANGGLFDQLKKILSPDSQHRIDEKTVVAGLKEALSQGTAEAVRLVARTNGYYGNSSIRILLPDKLKAAAATLKRVGFDRQVDEFVLGMNRAAERAAPKARTYFIDAIAQMTFEDARRILEGGNTAATDYLRTKMRDQLYDAFKPGVSASMNSVGVTGAYKRMMTTYASIPFVKPAAFDLDHYVTEKSLDGLFYMVGEEEKKIRTDPAARTTELLKKVFGSL